MIDHTEPHAHSGPGSASGADRLSPYVPRILQHRLVADPAGQWWTAEGTAAFVDISGFTQLSERLARKGREGSEQITDAIGTSFESILRVAYESGAGLLKFGGDSLLLWFHDPGHAARACRAAVLMRRVLRDVGRIEVPGAKVDAADVAGCAFGALPFFLGGHVPSRNAAGRPRVEPRRRDGARGQRRRHPASARRPPRCCRAGAWAKRRVRDSFSCASLRATRRRCRWTNVRICRRRHWRAVCRPQSAPMSRAAAARPSTVPSRSPSFSSAAPTRSSNGAGRRRRPKRCIGW